MSATPSVNTYSNKVDLGGADNTPTNKLNIERLTNNLIKKETWKKIKRKARKMWRGVEMNRFNSEFFYFC